jgi:Hemerythrin HHE cation binding domain
MSQDMSMNRVIHNAVRRDLGRLATALGSARDSDVGRARDLQRAYDNLHAQLTHHHKAEDAHVFPALRRLGVDPVLINEMDGEHEAMADALGSTAGPMQRYAGTGSAADAAAARSSVEQTRQVVDDHLTHEEAQLEPLMRPHLESEEWKQAERALRKLPPVTAGRFFAWVTDGMDPDSRAFLRTTIPAPVVALLSNLVGRQYHREIAPVWGV